MPATRRRPRASTPASGRPYVTAADVDRAADALLREGHRPTIEKVRAKIGRGSPNTVNPLLDAWWSRLAGRLDAGPAALHRIPEPVAHAAEGLWLTALDEARRRAQLESRNSKAALDRDRQDLAVQTHVLLLRESELKSRLEASDRRVATLETELAALTNLLRKEQASRLAAERRATEVAAPTRKPPRPRKSTAKKRRKRTVVKRPRR
jgi:hypothetical protein